MAEPFSEERLKELILNHPKHCTMKDRDCYMCRFLATIAADLKTIEELESEVKFNDKITELHYDKYRALEMVWQKVTGHGKTWPDRGKLLDWLKNHIDDHTATIERLRGGVDSLVSAIKQGRLTSIGSIENTYCPQIGKDWLDKIVRQAIDGKKGD